jgi:putative aldouronate transport system substrate-binding protein
MYKKKILTILTTVTLLILLLLTACQPPVKSQQSSETTEPKQEPIVISMVTEYAVNLPKGAENFIETRLEEKLGAKFQMTILGTGSDYATVLNTRISSGEIPDLIKLPMQGSSTGSVDVMHQYADNGVIMSLSPYIDELKPLLDWCGGNLEINKYKGEMYTIPVKANPGSNTYQSWFIRKDWLDTLNLEMPKTIEDVLDVAIAFTTLDPDKNNKDDTFGFSSSNNAGANGLIVFEGIFNAYDANYKNNFIIRDGKVTSALLQPLMKDALVMVKRFVDAGVVDPDILSNNDETLRDKMMQNKVGMTTLKWSLLLKQQYVDQFKEVSPNAELVWFGPPVGPGSDCYAAVDITGSMGDWVIGKHIAQDDAKRAKIFELLNYTATKEGQLLLCFGLEGVHYNIVDGQIKATDRIGETDFTYIYQITKRDDDIYLKGKFPECTDVIDYTTAMKRFEIYDNAVQTPDNFYKTDFDRYVNDNMIKFIYGERPISEYDDFLKELDNNFGFSEYLESAAAQIKEQGFLK